MSNHRKYTLPKERVKKKKQIPGAASPKLSVATAIPSSVDLRPFCSPVRDQLSLSSCTAFALCAALEVEESGRQIVFSPLFQYYNERAASGEEALDSGSTMSQGVDVVEKIGVCQEHFWPYEEDLLTQRPDERCFQDALLHKPHGMTQVEGANSAIKHCLASGSPVVLGIQVYASFESPNVTRTGRVPLPQRDEAVLGGHAVLCVGYMDDQACFICRNSWGSDWGDEGYFYLPYDYITEDNLISDVWRVSKEVVATPQASDPQMKFDDKGFLSFFTDQYAAKGNDFDPAMFAAAFSAAFSAALKK